LRYQLSVAVLDREHTTSVNTRSPIAYDRHLPSSLLLRHLRFDPHMLDGFKPLPNERLLERHGLIADLREKRKTPVIVDYIRLVCRRVATELALREESVSQTFQTLMEATLVTVTLALFNLEDPQHDIDDPDEGSDSEIDTSKSPSFFACVPSNEGEMIADKVVRLLKPDEELGLPPTLLPYTSMNPFFCIELKNILAADPRIYLSLLLLVAIALRTPGTLFPWPDTSCKQCSAFAESHKVFASMTRTTSSPRDKPDVEAPHIRASQQMCADLQHAINMVQEYIPKWDTLVGDLRRHKTGVTRTPMTPKGSDEQTLSKTRTAMENVFVDYGVKEEYQGSAKGWLQHAIYLTIRAHHLVLYVFRFGLTVIFIGLVANG
jgi:hypothetical protein